MSALCGGKELRLETISLCSVIHAFICESPAVEWKGDSGWFQSPSLGHWCHTHFVCSSFMAVVNVLQTWLIWRRPHSEFSSIPSNPDLLWDTQLTQIFFRENAGGMFFYQHFNESNESEWKGDLLEHMNHPKMIHSFFCSDRLSLAHITCWT